MGRTHDLKEDEKGTSERIERPDVGVGPDARSEVRPGRDGRIEVLPSALSLRSDRRVVAEVE